MGLYDAVFAKNFLVGSSTSEQVATLPAGIAEQFAVWKMRLRGNLECLKSIICLSLHGAA